MLAATLAVVTALSDPLAVIALLPAIVILVRDRRWIPDLIAPAVLIGALGIQQWVHLHETTFRFSQTVRQAIPEILGLRVVLNVLVGDRYLGPVYDALGPASVVGASALLAVVVIGLAYRSKRASILSAAVFLVGAAAMTGLSLELRGTAGYLARHLFNLFPSRYFVVSIVFLWSALAILVDGRRTKPRDATAMTRPRRHLAGTATAALAVVVVAEVIVGYSSDTVRTYHPTWSSNMSYMEAALPSTAQSARATGRGIPRRPLRNPRHAVPIGPDDVSVYPDGEPGPGIRPVFALVLPCSKLRG